MHKTKDKKFNTIHDINKFVKRGYIISLSKDKRLLKISEKILGGKTTLRNLEFFLNQKQEKSTDSSR